MKTVIQVWATKCQNQVGRWGFGDILKGTLNLLKESKRRGLKYYVETKFHPLGEFFHAGKLSNPDSSLIDPDKINHYAGDSLRSVLDTFQSSSENMIYIFSNCLHEESITSEDKEALKDILRPKDFLESQILLRMPSHPYHILHIRIGDSHLVSGQTLIPDSIFRLIQQEKTKNCFLLSDSKELKKQFLDINQTSFDPVHSGHAHKSDDLDNYEVNIDKTLVEFFIATRSQGIKTYSVYYWTSGFMLMASLIYGVPLKDIKEY
jgi:hypothetical protein